jgi:hypothetical protein
MAQKALTVARVDAKEALTGLGVIFTNQKTDCSGGLASAADQLDGAQCFAVFCGGDLVGHYALGVREYEGGPEVVIVAARGRMPTADLIASLLPTIEQQCQGAKALTVHTKRRGLVAKLAGYGFRLDGFILHKRLA